MDKKHGHEPVVERTTRVVSSGTIPAFPDGWKWGGEGRRAAVTDPVCPRGMRLPHESSNDRRILRTDICASLLARNAQEPFLWCLITVDEKWVLHVNTKHKKKWGCPKKQATPQRKENMHPQKTTLRV